MYVNASAPMNPVLGVYVNVPFPFDTAVPLTGEATIATDAALIPPSSVSLETTLIVTSVFIDVEAVSFTAVGGMFCALTVTVTVAWFDTAPWPSATVYLNESVPVNDSDGVYVTVPFPFDIAVPFAGEATIATVAASIPTSSVSLEITLMVTAVFIVVVTPSFLASAGRLLPPPK